MWSKAYCPTLCVCTGVVCSAVGVCLLGIVPRVHRVAMNMCSRLCVCVCVVWSVAAQAPVVSVAPQSATVRQGESFSFRCQVSSGAQPVLEWRRANNQPLPGQDQSYDCIYNLDAMSACD